MLELDYCAFQKHADSKIQSSTDKCVFRYRQPNVRRLLPASDCCQARGIHIVVHNSDNETVLGSSRKLGGPAFVGRPVNFRVCVLLKSAVSTPEKASISRKRKVNVDVNIERLWFYTSYTRVCQRSSIYLISTLARFVLLEYNHVVIVIESQYRESDFYDLG